MIMIGAPRINRPRAFTLIELLIVVGIIAILALIAIPNFLEAQCRSKVARTKSDMRTIVTALESYAADHNHYPPNYDTGHYPGIHPSSEYLTFAALTTPIAYLASAPLDMFRTDPSDLVRERYYDYIGADTVLALNDDYTDAEKEYWAERGLRFCIVSVAPDLSSQELGQRLHDSERLVYDPTNGSVSRGDLARTNLGSVPST